MFSLEEVSRRFDRLFVNEPSLSVGDLLHKEVNEVQRTGCRRPFSS